MFYFEDSKNYILSYLSYISNCHTHKQKEAVLLRQLLFTLRFYSDFLYYKGYNTAVACLSFADKIEAPLPHCPPFINDSASVPPTPGTSVVVD
jgi:hypothetical protein